MDYITTGVSKTPEQAGIQLTTETFTVPKTKNDIKPIEEETSEKIESAPVVEDKKAENIESAPVVEDKKPEITEPDTHDTKDKSLKSFLGRIKKAVVPEIDEDAFEHENKINASTKPIDNTPKPVIAPAKLVEKPQPIVAPVEPVEKPQPIANPAEPVKKAPSAPIKETTTESDIYSRYEKLFGKTIHLLKTAKALIKQNPVLKSSLVLKIQQKIMKVPTINKPMLITSQKMIALFLKSLFKMMKKMFTTEPLKAQFLL